jgi:hypothetical protein
MATPKVISCNGQEFGSIKALADHYGLPKEKVTRRLAQGWSPEQAVGLLTKKRTGSTGKPVEFEGKRFPSLVAACTALGLDPRLIAARVRNGYSLEDALRGNLKDRSSHWGKAIAFRGCVFQSQEELATKYSLAWRTVWKRQQRGWTLEQALGREPAPPRFRNFEGHARDHKWKEVRVRSFNTNSQIASTEVMRLISRLATRRLALDRCVEYPDYIKAATFAKTYFLAFDD